MFGRVPDGPYFYLGTSGRNAHHELEARGEECPFLAVDLLDESADHHLGCIEVSYDPVFQRADRLDPGMLVLVHQFGLVPECDAFPRIALDSYDARLVQHYLVILENDGVGGPEIHRKLLSQE